MESILTSIKKMLGITEEYTHFDDDLIMHINSVFMILTQLGVGPKEGFYIEDDLATWDEFLQDPVKLQGVKTYIYLKTKQVFDPPSSSIINECHKQMISELEWRLNSEVDY